MIWLVGGAAVVLYLLLSKTTVIADGSPGNQLTPIDPSATLPASSTKLQQEQVRKFSSIAAIAGSGATSLAAALGVSAATAGPIGAAVAAVVVGFAMIRGTAHLVANEWTLRVQTPFGDALKAIVDEKDRSIREGSATSRSVSYARQATQTLWNRYHNEAAKFRQVDKDHAIVIDQSYETLDYRFTADGRKVGTGLMTRILADMDRQIAELP